MTGGRTSHRTEDCLYLLLLGAGVAALAWFWRFETPPPSLLEDLACAAGLRPPAEPLNLLWQTFAMPLCGWLGLPAACAVLRMAGHVSLGVVAIVACVLFEMLLPATLKRGEHVAAWWRTAVRFVVFQGAVFLCCSDPVWSAFRWFSPLSLQMLLASFSVLAFTAHMRYGWRWPLFPTFFLLGLLAVDTPEGAFLAIVAASTLGIRAYCRANGLLAQISDQRVALPMAWYLTLAFVAGALLGGTAAVRTFGSAGGLEAFGWSWGDLALDIPFRYIKAAMSASSILGWVLAVSVAILPLLVELELLRHATDEERRLLYIQGLAFAVFGVVAFSQLSGAKPLWFWTWTSGGEAIHSGLFLCGAVFLCALSVVWSLSVFTMELFFRNSRRIELRRHPDVGEDPAAAKVFAMERRMQRVVRTCLLLEPLVAVACTVPFRAQTVERAMLGVVADAAVETARECSDIGYIFTDGGLDAAVELAAAMEGRMLRALSLMGGAADPRAIFLRTRGIEDPEDKALLEIGAADALRTWVRSRPDKAGTFAVQIGFELWRRDGKPLPKCSGLVARPGGLSDEEAERGAAAGRALAKRVLGLYEAGRPDGIADHALRDAFLFAQWRLSVLSRHRANAYDSRGESALAMDETRMADALDKKNGALARIRDTMAWAGRKKLERMTPWEGLKLGLSKADFSLARVFALKVLDISPDDPSANFALGMDYFVQRQYVRAQAYLERCLVHRPDDPAVLNNLAQCCLRQGNPAAALPYAERAKKILPDSPEVNHTLERVREALKTAPGPNPDSGHMRE